MASPSQRSAPISHHPLFPTIVALWFAALLGLGSIVVRASVLERIVLAAHIDVLIPAAAPPLGFTARLLLTLVMTFGGGVLGFVLARRLASAAPSRRAPAPVIVPEPVQPARDDSAAAASDDDDDGEDLARLDAARAAQPRRRRGLTADESAAPTTLPDAAPLPGRTPPMLTLGDLDSLPPLGPVTPEVPASAEAAPAPAPTAPPPVELAKTALDFPLRMPPALAPLPLAASAPADASAADRLRGEPLEALGTVELVERFALALAARRAGAESTAEPVQPLAEADRRFDIPPAQRKPDFASVADSVGESAPRPAFAAPQAPAPAEDFDDETIPDPAFSSLLDMKPPLRIALRGDVRPDPGATGNQLGGAAAASLGAFRPPLAANASDPAETERELREALAALQRMSGAA